MATHSSAIKRHRQSIKRRARNREVQGGLRAAIKRTRVYAAEGDVDNAREWLGISISRLDRAAKKGVIHKNNAARRKSRLVKLVNQVEA